ncbi:MAG TPA: hypothetical protein VJ804_06445, partial [Acidimicrobiales bacterium]|nr:hypothetical protein [Acidimicrobiales bacterium]
MSGTDATIAGFPVVVRHLLAFGVRPWDPLTDRAIVAGVGATVEAPAGSVTAERHTGGRFSVRHRPGLPPSVVLRLADAEGRRQVVPRRLEVPIPTWDEVEAASTADEPSPRQWAHQVALFPGAAAATAAPATV